MTGRGHNHEWTFERLCSRPVRKILVIKLRAIGDVLLSTAVLPNLRHAFPDAQIDFLTEHPSRHVIEGNPYLSNTLIFHTKRDNIVSYFLRLYKEKYDLVFDLFCNPRSAQLCFATRAPIRVGYPFRGRAYAYNVYVDSRSDDIHNTEFNLDPLTAVGIPVPIKEIHFPLNDKDRDEASALLAKAKIEHPLVIALNSSGTWETKRWGLQHFAELADALVERYNALPVLLWGPGEEQDVREIERRMQHTPFIPPRTTLKQLGALLSLCDYTISNDSGPMHISAAVGTPTLGIFGPTNPLLQGPYNPRSTWVRLEGLDCLACNATSCNIGNICMAQLEVSAVLAAFERMRTGRETTSAMHT